MENAIMNLARVYPSMLMSDADPYKKIPKQWNLSSHHEDQITDFLKQYYEELDKFKQKPVLAKLLMRVNERLANIILFIKHIPIYTGISQNIADKGEAEEWRTFHLLFDKETVYMLHTYCFLTVLHMYIECSYDKELLDEHRSVLRSSKQVDIEASKQASERLVAQYSDILDEGAVEEMEKMEQIDVVLLGQQETLQITVASLLYAFLNIEIENKRVINVTYDDIVKKERKVKEREIEQIVSLFRKMDVEERKVENMFKNFKIGRWNAGMQKGLVTYDKETFDRERNDLLRQLSEGEAVVTATGFEFVGGEQEEGEDEHEEDGYGEGDRDEDGDGDDVEY